MNVIKAIYNFLVGDMIILIGVILIVIVLALITYINLPAPLHGALAVLLIAAVIGILTATLYREARGKR